ncbi:unnamed protein product [Bemisia tabaci]|uniref:Uncharacterized protein n=1 Tax=Bemisia tabaci TaxID=7038 RepID=A0A9P0ADB8_BEMTA|nr:unnamed protein product [Bemisia tabaci]
MVKESSNNSIKMSISTNQALNKMNSLLAELQVQKNLVRNLRKNDENLSMENLALRQELEVLRHQLSVTEKQMDILKDTAAKLQNLNVSTTLDQKVAYEAKDRETIALRELNLQIQRENMKLNRQLEELKGSNIAILEGTSQLKRKKEKKDHNTSVLKREFENLRKSHAEVMKKCDANKGHDQKTKIIAECLRKKCDALHLENEKLQKENVLLSSEVQLQRRKLEQTLDAKGTKRNYSMVEKQDSSRCQEELKRQSEINSKLQLTVAEAINKNKKLKLQKQDLEAELLKYKDKN